MQYLSIAATTAALIGTAYGAHRWYCGVIDSIVEKKVSTRIEYINIKLDVLMTREQKELAYRIWLQYKDEHGIK